MSNSIDLNIPSTELCDDNSEKIDSESTEIASSSATATTSVPLLVTTKSQNITMPSAIEKCKQKIIMQSISSTTKLNTGSATGNPRNKCALKPGHSLMDWIRLGNSGIDLAGTKGRVTPITHAELQKHNKENDAWIAIRGKVFNITQYMNFHPGGIDELMKGAGKEATKLFDDVHAWVNYEQLLQKCFIGPLRNTGALTITSITGDDTPFLLPKSPTKQSTDSTASLVPMTTSGKLTPQASPKKSSNNVELTTQAKSSDFEILPRFDWIQKTNNITLIFYTKPLCNPSVVIKLFNYHTLNIIITINNIINNYKIILQKDILWPPDYIKITQETGKIEIVLKKEVLLLWSNYGLLERIKLYNNNNSELVLNEYLNEYRIIECTAINHNSYGVLLKPIDDLIQINSIGYHISLSGLINGTEMTRSYTPVPNHYMPNKYTAPCISLLIKSYENGYFSRFLTEDWHRPDKIIKVSMPKGNFKLKNFKLHKNVCILVGGSGITPILSILDYIHENKTLNVIIHLIFFNRTEKDIWCRNNLDNLSINDNRFIIQYILSEQISDDDDDNTAHGTSNTIINKQLSYELLKTLIKIDTTFFLICGPPKFNDLTTNLLYELQYTDENIHCFQG